MHLDTHETIVAPATPPGEGGIGIVRLSGKRAEELLGKVFLTSLKVDRLTSHRLYHGKIVDSDNFVVDEVMAVIMRKPNSYTKEDVVEIQCHGGGVVQRRILHLLVDAGARLARPGEFTYRAFVNGRIDLAEAEAVIDVIRCRSEAACQVAVGQLTGKLSRVIFSFRDQLIELLAEVEAGIDFPEEDVPQGETESLFQRGQDLIQEFDRLLESFESGRVLKEGLSILIFGKPNVGKSSLMNCLLGEARTIVTEIPGTTRDTIEESLVLGGIPLRLVDTAGIRETNDPVEAEGVKRARDKVATADLVLLVVDGSRPLDSDDRFALDACRGAKVLLVQNKADLGSLPLSGPFIQLPFIEMSTLSGSGLDSIQEHINTLFHGDTYSDTRESVIVSDTRHREALVRGKKSLQSFLTGISGGAPPEILAIELREALGSLGEITGETTPDNILENIFSRFCIGK